MKTSNRLANLPLLSILATQVVTGVLASVAFADNGGGGRGNPCLPGDAVPDQVVLELMDNASIDEVMAIVTPLFPGVEVAFAFPEEDLYLLSAPDPICEKQLVLTLMALPGVEEAEYNETGESVEGQTQSFFFASSQSQFDGQYLWPTIRLIDAQTETLGEGIVIAIIDSGLSASHPIFANTTILPGVDFINDGMGFDDLGNGEDDDGDGAIDELAGHGTYLAGLITKIAPAASILPLRAIDTDGRGTAFAVAGALVEAHQRGAHIINLSFSNGEDIGVLEPILDAIVNDGIMVVVSAGNAGQESNGTFPAKMGPVCAVAATDEFDVKAAFSNSGSYVSLCAPGVGVVSAFPGGGYVIADGTSAAAAIISGTAALVMSKDQCDGDVAHITVEETAIPIAQKNPKAGESLGAGRVDAAGAVDAIPMPGDFDHDRRIDMDDLSVLLGAWGTPVADLNGDGTTNAIDLSILIGSWTG